MSNVTVYDLMYLCCTDYATVEIYDLTTNKTVFEGMVDDVKYSEYSDYGVCSFEMSEKPWCMVINIETE